MRAYIFTMVTLVFGVVTQLKAQVPNPSFEDTNICGLSRYWSFIPLQAIIVDSNGVEHIDSIIWDGVNYLNYPVNDAHSGNYAMSLRNAYSYTYDYVLPGRSTLFADSNECSAFYLTLLPVTGDITEFSFYYKYFPVNNDTAYAKVILYDTVGNEIATAEKLIIGSQTVYTLGTMPFNYTSTDPVAFYSVEFYNTIPDGNPHQISFGTRLYIDDVGFNFLSSISEETEHDDITVFPNPASTHFSIKQTGNYIFKMVSIADLQGRTVKYFNTIDQFYDCSSLEKGVYIVNIETNEGTLTQKLVVQN